MKYIGLQWFTVLCTLVSMCPIFTVCWHKTAILAQPETALIVCCETLGPEISRYNFNQDFTTLGFSMETTNWSLGRNRLSFVNHKCTAQSLPWFANNLFPTNQASSIQSDTGYFWLFCIYSTHMFLVNNNPMVFFMVHLGYWLTRN